MRKTPLLFLFFLFGAIIGGFLYLDSQYFFEKKLCDAQQGWWNEQESTCKTQEDKKNCQETKGKWIEEEYTCDYGIIL